MANFITALAWIVGPVATFLFPFSLYDDVVKRKILHRVTIQLATTMILSTAWLVARYLL